MSDVATALLQLIGRAEPVADPALAAVKLARATIDALILRLGQTIDAKVTAQLAGGLTQLTAGGETFVLKLETPLPVNTAVTLKIAPTPTGQPAVTVTVQPQPPVAQPAPPAPQPMTPLPPPVAAVPVPSPVLATAPQPTPVASPPSPTPPAAVPLATPAITTATPPLAQSSPPALPPTVPAQAPALPPPSPAAQPAAAQPPLPQVIVQPAPMPAAPVPGASPPPVVPIQPAPVATTAALSSPPATPTAVPPSPPSVATSAPTRAAPASLPISAPSAPIATALAPSGPPQSPTPPPATTRVAPSLAPVIPTGPAPTIAPQPAPSPASSPPAPPPAAPMASLPPPLTALLAPTARPATPPPASPPLTQILADPVQAAARQDSVLPLIARLATLAAPTAAALSRPALEAIATLVSTRLDLNRAPPDGKAIRDAVLRAGVVTEPGTRTPVDAKSALLQLRSALSAFLGGEVEAVAPVTRRPPPPLRGEPVRAPAAQPAPPLAEEPVETARQLLGHTDAALSRTKLLQLASNPADATRPNIAAPAAEFRVEVPMQLGAETGILQLLVERDSKHKRTPAERGWRMRFALNFTATGEVGAEVALLGHSANVSLWAAEPATADALEAMLPELAPALARHGLDVGSVRVRRGAPHPAARAPGQLLDSAR